MIEPTWISDCGTVKLWCCDNAQIWDVWRVDAIVTDPPYGIGADVSATKMAGTQSAGQFAPRVDYGESDWDLMPATDDQIDRCLQISDWQIIFGGNYFKLPPTSCLLIWDKLMGGNWADCEVAWTNLKKAIRRLVHLWSGGLRKGAEKRYHPTQKPVDVIRWCIQHLPSTVKVIGDPWMGSGSHGVAAIREAKCYLGCDADERYFEIAKNRIQHELRNPRLITQVPKKPLKPSGFTKLSKSKKPKRKPGELR